MNWNDLLQYQLMAGGGPSPNVFNSPMQAQLMGARIASPNPLQMVGQPTPDMQFQPMQTVRSTYDTPSEFLHLTNPDQYQIQDGMLGQTKAPGEKPLGLFDAAPDIKPPADPAAAAMAAPEAAKAGFKPSNLMGLYGLADWLGGGNFDPRSLSLLGLLRG